MRVLLDGLEESPTMKPHLISGNQYSPQHRHHTHPPHASDSAQHLGQCSGKSGFAKKLRPKATASIRLTNQLIRFSAV